MPEHRRTALPAADMVADLPDAFAFLGCLIPTPCAFDRDGFFVDVFVDDRLEFFIAGVLRILQYRSSVRAELVSTLLPVPHMA